MRRSVCPARILNEARSLLHDLADRLNLEPDSDLDERVDNNLLELEDLIRRLPNKV